MPYKSKAQRRYFHWAESKGKLPKGTAAEWEAGTVKKDLPEHVEKKAAFEGGFKAVAKRVFKPDHLDLAGLGMLAVPAAHDLVAKKPLSNKSSHAWDLAGLGTLAAGTLKKMRG